MPSRLLHPCILANWTNPFVIKGVSGVLFHSIVFFILTHLAYIANGKNRVLFCKNSLGGNLVTLFVSLTLDVVTSFLRVINVRNTCKRLRYSQIFGGFSSVKWRNVECIQLLSFIVC